MAASATITRTNDLGNYRIGPIAAGTYYLVAAAEPWYVKQTAVLSRMRREAGQTPPQDPAYAPTYYPNVTDPHAASPLVLKVGGEGRADFTLRTIVGANVHPVCANTTPEAENAQPNPLPNNPTNGFNADDFRRLQQFGRSNPIPNNRCPGSVNLYLHGIGDVETLFSTTYAGISDVVSGVPPGRYTVRYSAPGGTMRKVVDIGGGDVTVDLGALPAPSINGTVSLMNPGTAPKATMYVRLLNEVTGAAIARPIQPDGSFTWTNVPAGRYRPQVTSADGIFISSITASGAELKNGIIDLAEGMSVQLRVVASDETGRLKGFVRNGDKPAPAVLVVLAPRGGSTDPYDYAAFQSDSDGSFDFVNERAGEYVLFSVEQLDFEYAKSDAVRPYLVVGKPIRVAPHGTYSESISVTLAGSTK